MLKFVSLYHSTIRVVCFTLTLVAFHETELTFIIFHFQMTLLLTSTLSLLEQSLLQESVSIILPLYG